MNHANRVAAVALDWIGTPFSPHACAKGVGADCIQIALGVYKEAGVVPPELQFPPYRLDGWQARSSLVTDWIRASKLFEPVAESAAGDLLVFRVGKSDHHVGVQVDAVTFVHCWRDYGVSRAYLKDPTWGKRVLSKWRPL